MSSGNLFIGGLSVPCSAFFLHDYENESGKTVTFSCDRCADALRLAELALDGQRAMQKSYVDMIVDVHEISYLNKCHITDEEEEY